MSEESHNLELSIPYRFSQVKLLRLALTHSSYANESLEPCEDNERLEFLGDAVLELATTQELFLRFPDADEGSLTAIRSGLVKERSLAAIARRLGLDRHVLLGRGEEAQGGRDRDSMLADALEAVIGAVFLDGGFSAARTVVLDLFKGRWPVRAETPRTKDFKSRLQETTQQLWAERPTYALEDSRGPEHEKVFTVRLRLPNGKEFVAEGSSVKRAEQGAAESATAYLEDVEGDAERR